MAVVQYTFTHKQYIEQHNRQKQYIEQHNSLISKSADGAPSLRGTPWHLPYNWGKSTEKTSVRVTAECQLAKSIENRANVSVRIHSHSHDTIDGRYTVSDEVHTLTPHSFAIQFNIILPFTPMSTKWSLPSRFSDQTFLSSITHLSKRITHPVHPILLEWPPK
jgi:hypothetical protein